MAAVSTDRPQCRALVHRKDTYRYTGRSKSGFEMHYQQGQCKRKSVEGSDLCRQHRDCGWNILRVPDLWITDTENSPT